jgi:hypothetical protein
MAGEPFHETGITVPAAMAAPHIGINAVIKAADARFGEDALREDLLDDHVNYYNGGKDKLKGSNGEGISFAVATLLSRSLKKGQMQGPRNPEE